MPTHKTTRVQKRRLHVTRNDASCIQPSSFSDCRHQNDIALTLINTLGASVNFLTKMNVRFADIMFCQNDYQKQTE